MNPHRDHEDVKDRPPLTISARAPLKLSTDDVDNGGFASRAAKQLLSVDDGGASTESEAESSYQGWSDNGWRTSPASPRPRASLSSGDERSLPALQQTTTTIPQGSSSMISHSVASGSNTGHRRQTVSRPAVNQLKPIVSQDTLLAKRHGASTILDIDESTSPATMVHPSPIGNGLDLHQSYPRARRKSLSHESPVLPRPGSHDDPPLNGSLYSKGKKKRSRATSFSLPFHRRRRLSNASDWRWLDPKFPSPFRRWFLALLLLVGSFLFAVILWRRRYELQIEFSVFSHFWIRSEIDTSRPLRGCFDRHNVSPDYNLSLNSAPKRQLLSPGISLRRGMSCYDFSSTVQPIPDIPVEPLTYHTYWRCDLIPFGERHTATLTSFLATQPLAYSKLILWTNGAELISTNEFVRPYIENWGDHIEVRQVDMSTFTRGTELGGLLSSIDGGGLFDERGWVDGDAVRLLVLWHYGGVWLDMDQVLTRDLHPLTESEFVIQWDCYDKPYFSLNGALMHFRRHSPYLCEAFHIMASSPLPKPNTFTWGSHLYAKLHRRLIAGRQQPFAVLPWCFADPRNCRSDIRFPDPFRADPEYWGGRRWDGRGEVGRSGRELLEEKLGYIWSVHLHNQWKKMFPVGGWMMRLLDGYEVQLKESRRSGRMKRDASGEELVVADLEVDREELVSNSLS